MKYQGRIQDFKLGGGGGGGGAHLKKLRRAERGTKNVGVFRVKKHDFYAKKIIFFPIVEGGAKKFGVFRVKNHDFTPTKSFFFSILGGGARRVRPPSLNPPLNMVNKQQYVFYRVILVLTALWSSTAQGEKQKDSYLR